MTAKPDHPEGIKEPTPDDPSPMSGIELQPSTALPLPARYVERPGDSDDGNVDEAYAIPGRPLHLCPSCDYNLTGLTARRCPECGQDFTIHEARLRGFETSEPMQKLIRSENWAKTRMVAGWVLMAAAFVGTNSIRITFSPFSFSVSTWTALTTPGFIMLIFTISMLIILSVVRAYYDLTWPNVILVAGLIAGSIGALFVF